MHHLIRGLILTALSVAAGCVSFEPKYEGNLMSGGAGDRSTFLTKTGWGQSGNLVTGDRTQRVTMQADFSKGVGAFDFTAQFNISPPQGGNAIANAEALLHWRVEGQEVSRR